MRSGRSSCLSASSQSTERGGTRLSSSKRLLWRRWRTRRWRLPTTSPTFCLCRRCHRFGTVLRERGSVVSRWEEGEGGSSSIYRRSSCKPPFDRSCSHLRPPLRSVSRLTLIILSSSTLSTSRSSPTRRLHLSQHTCRRQSSRSGRGGRHPKRRRIRMRRSGKGSRGGGGRCRPAVEGTIEALQSFPSFPGHRHPFSSSQSSTLFFPSPCFLPDSFYFALPLLASVFDSAQPDSFPLVFNSPHSHASSLLPRLFSSNRNPHRPFSNPHTLNSCNPPSLVPIYL